MHGALKQTIGALLVLLDIGPWVVPRAPVWHADARSVFDAGEIPFDAIVRERDRCWSIVRIVPDPKSGIGYHSGMFHLETGEWLGPGDPVVGSHLKGTWSLLDAITKAPEPTVSTYDWVEESRHVVGRSRGTPEELYRLFIQGGTALLRLCVGLQRTPSHKASRSSPATTFGRTGRSGSEKHWINTGNCGVCSETQQVAPAVRSSSTRFAAPIRWSRSGC